MPKTHKILTEYPVFKVILRYALPSVMGLLFYGMQNVLDGIIVGRFMGTDALAGVNLIFPLYSAIAVIAIMTGVGSQATIGRSLGRKEVEKAKAAVTTGFLFVVAGCTVFAIPAFIFAGNITSLLGANAELFPYSAGYMKGLMLLSPFIGLMFYSDYMLKIGGHPRYAFLVMSSTILLNVTLNLTFILLFDLGTFGVGLATGLAFMTGSLMGSFILFKKKSPISMLAGRFKLKLLREMLYNGSSEGMTEFSVGISLLLFNYTFMQYAGSDGVAAFTVVGYISFLGTTLFLGVSDGLIPVISYNYGIGNHHRVRQILKFAARINFTIGTFIFLSFLFFSRYMVELFVGGKDTAVVDLAVSGASIYAFAFLLEGFNILLSSYYTALGKARYSLVIASLRGLILIIAGLLIFPRWMGAPGIWITVPVAEAITVTAALFLLKKPVKKS